MATNQTQRTKFKKLALIAAEVASDKKAENIRVIDLQNKSSLTDFIVIATASSTPQMEAIRDEITKRLKEDGINPIHKDGYDSRNWHVLDYGGFMAHIANAEAREFYGLDKIYSFGKTVKAGDAETETPAKATPKAKSGAGKTKKSASPKRKISRK